MAQKPSVESRLADVRKRRGVSASDLARRVGVSRQTIYAIEAGTYVPNTEVALNLARELEVTVDDLFSLRSSTAPAAQSLSAEVLAAIPPPKGQPVRICQVGSRWVAVPVSPAPYYLPEADGIVERPGRSAGRASLLALSADEPQQKRLVLAGCDPATGLLGRVVEKASGVEMVCAGASSKLALSWLAEGKVHIAGSHLEDAKTGEFNLPFLRQLFPGDEFAVVTFARWEEGLVVAPGNPKAIRSIEDAARKDVRIANRELGSGARSLLDRLLAKASIPTRIVAGYDRICFGHLSAAYAVFAAEADLCLATRSAAIAFNLDFIPLHTERYDLVLRKRSLDLPAVKVFLDVLQLASLRRKLEVLAGYDTSETGKVLS